MKSEPEFDTFSPIAIDKASEKPCKNDANVRGCILNKSAFVKRIFTYPMKRYLWLKFESLPEFKFWLLGRHDGCYL